MVDYFYSSEVAIKYPLSIGEIALFLPGDLIIVLYIVANDYTQKDILFEKQIQLFWKPPVCYCQIAEENAMEYRQSIALPNYTNIV